MKHYKIKDKKKIKIRFPIGGPTRILTPNKHYTKEIKRPTTREIIEETQEEEKVPYIKQTERLEYDDYIDDLCEKLRQRGWEPGHLNYIIFSILKNFFEANRCYRTVCEINGTLSSIGFELYRRFFGPYEEIKLQENGDV